MKFTQLCKMIEEANKHENESLIDVLNYLKKISEEIDELNYSIAKLGQKIEFIERIGDLI